MNNPKYEIGDIHAGDFPRRSVVEKMMNIVDIDRRKACLSCDYRYLCGGGCPVGLFSVADNANASDKIKNYTQDISCAIGKTVLTELFWSLSATIGSYNLPD